MTAWTIEALTAQHRRARMLEAHQERLAARASARPQRRPGVRAAASLGQLLATRREAMAR